MLPFTLIYGFIVYLRNVAYDRGIFRSRSFEIPVISIGNLIVGGSGKSPMAEYLVRLLKEEKKVAVLSRGYGRRTKGFRLVEKDDDAADTGDEPLQFKRKFPEITVAVCEKRVEGIERLKAAHDVVILDDAFQHRAVRPGLNILLWDYTRLSEFMLPLPAGNLREGIGGSKRADLIVITKTPELLSLLEKQTLRRKVRPCEHQPLFFSSLDYGNLIPLFSGEEIALSEAGKDTLIFLLTGIANPAPLLEQLKVYFDEIRHHDYPDHHPFSTKNIAKLADDFRLGRAKKKLIITTEKDAQRLRTPELAQLLSLLPVYYLPVLARIQKPDAGKFENLIKNYVSKY